MNQITFFLKQGQRRASSGLTILSWSEFKNSTTHTRSITSSNAQLQLWTQRTLVPLSQSSVWCVLLILNTLHLILIYKLKVTINKQPLTGQFQYSLSKPNLTNLTNSELKVISRLIFCSRPLRQDIISQNHSLIIRLFVCLVFFYRKSTFNFSHLWALQTVWVKAL